MKQILLFTFAVMAVGLTGCNFSPGALLGDVNDDPWEWNSSSNYNYDYNYGTRYSSACNPREINETNNNRGTCSVPGKLGNRLAKITGREDRLEIEIRKDDADDNFQISSLSAMRDRYTKVNATCTEDKNEARTFSQRFVCTVPAGNSSTTDRFDAMTITNLKCNSSTAYTLPTFCSSYEAYTVKYGSEYFPTF